MVRGNGGGVIAVTSRAGCPATGHCVPGVEDPQPSMHVPDGPANERCSISSRHGGRDAEAVGRGRAAVVGAPAEAAGRVSTISEYGIRVIVGDFFVVKGVIGIVAPIRMRLGYQSTPTCSKGRRQSLL